MTRRFLLLTVAVVGTVSVTGAALFKEYKSGLDWPEPVMVDPGDGTNAPSDAVILFDGDDLSAFNGGDKWIVKDGVATANGGSITSKEKFGDVQIHIEWATPDEVKGNGQGRGNSGVYVMGKYEVQILDSYENPTYFDGQAASIYKQKPPLVNASRGPGQWQEYDILFTAPRFADDGKLLSPAYVTVLHNGIVVQNHTELQGGTSYTAAPTYKKHPEELPLSIQYHGNPMRFRNIWARRLTDITPKNGTYVDGVHEHDGEHGEAAADAKPKAKTPKAVKEAEAEAAPKAKKPATVKEAEAAPREATEKSVEEPQAAEEKAATPAAAEPEEK